ncbi:MAG: DUF1353 domain-containing protein [Actinomycetota bacterium]|nr:DUF1353 domain-containing protein [Actinomycetota bacterium]
MELEGTGFDDDARVVVQQHDDEQWIVWEPFSYRAASETFTVPRGMCTDFASVPRPFVWYLPRYGPYTLAAVLHDHLWRDRAATGKLSYVDADGIFRRAMRELDVPFLHRWLMWAAVRWAALVKPGGRAGWGQDAPRVLLLTVVALPVMAVPVAAILTAMVQLFVLELVLWVPLAVHARWARLRGRTPAKEVVRPRLELRLQGGKADDCPPAGWERLAPDPMLRPRPPG